VAQVPQCRASCVRSTQLELPQLSHAAPSPAPASLVRASAPIQPRTHSSRLGATPELPGGITSPHPDGTCPLILAKSSEASGSPGTTSVCPSQLEAATEISEGPTSARVKSRAAAALLPAWQPAVAHRGIRIVLCSEGKVGEQAVTAASASPTPASSASWGTSTNGSAGRWGPSRSAASQATSVATSTKPAASLTPRRDCMNCPSRVSLS
jgi:hypothetical protein